MLHTTTVLHFFIPVNKAECRKSEIPDTDNSSCQISQSDRISVIKHRKVSTFAAAAAVKDSMDQKMFKISS